MPYYIVLLGAPGAGKGTQAALVSETLGLPHVSSGDIFRENIKNQTELGRKAEEYLNRGDLVPDDLTIAMIRDRLAREDCSGGAVLDGFPRTPAQADALDAMLTEFGGRIDIVPYIKVAEDVLVERLSGRWTCRENGHIFHQVFNPPKAAGVCDIDGSELYQREDDRAETVSNRIQVYLEQTAPLISHYSEKGLIAEVEGDKGIDDVTGSLLSILEREV
ncbi:MAG: adenylate kinase [Anaerolineae bacterium]|nr:adenylate kinase [Anaerolineae bacterium]